MKNFNENNLSLRNLDYTSYIVFHSSLNQWFGWPLHCVKSKMDLLLVLSEVSYDKYFTYISSRFVSRHFVVNDRQRHVPHFTALLQPNKKYNIAYTGYIVKIKYYYIKFGQSNKFDYYNRTDCACKVK